MTQSLMNMMLAQAVTLAVMGFAVSCALRQYRLLASVCARPCPEHRSLERCSVK
ncbi:MAG: hypothetical protein J6V64_02975 [Burkholderiaceae bacterium]|nr:hypothetical protein [Burkholderiaceae bacterium]